MAGVRRSIREIKEAYLRGLDEGISDVADAFLNEATRIIEAEALDTGSLNQSAEIRKPGPRRRIVAWPIEHAVYVHYGTRPHWPPLAPILAWVRRNARTVITPTGTRSTRIRPGAAARTVKAPDAELLTIARAIQAKIAKEGTPPVPWVPRAMSRIKPQTSRILREAVERQFQ